MKKIFLSLVFIALGTVLVASPVKSMLGADGAEKGETWAPSASDYIQDGLVVMWDGIENAGHGLHDDGATVWKDLAGDSDMPTTLSSLSWDSDALVRTGINGFDFTPNIDLSDPLSPRTFEWVMSAEGLPTETTTHYYFWAINNAGIRNPLQAGSGYVGCTLRADGGVVRTLVYAPSFKSSFTMTASDEYYSATRKNYYVYVEGNYVSRAQFGGNPTTSPILSLFRFSRNWPSENTIRIHSFRIYNRNLSAEEVRYNYLIDKMRFNLP